MPLTQALAASPALLTAVAGILGLMVGSFLNVVILRLPRMLEQTWWQDARSHLRLPPRPAPRYSLIHPASHCPRCGSPVKPWHNVPVLSWLWLCGRCANCAAPISIQYPLVELAAGMVAAVCAWRFGWSAQLPGALLLSWALLALTVIDLRTQLLPDLITLPLLWAGLLLALASLFCDLRASVIGAAAGYLLLWSIYWLFKLLTGKDGMGYGDFKLLAALGAWLGWQALPSIVLISSGVGALTGLGLIALRRLDRSTPMPFGPFLAVAGWIALIWDHALFFRLAG